MNEGITAAQIGIMILGVGIGLFLATLVWWLLEKIFPD